ncbi:MAG: hypothetical protein ACOCRX_07430 [Candidatus Woesearchaeota archaeon]
MSKKYYYFITLTNVYVFDDNLKRVKSDEIEFDPERFDEIKKEIVDELKNEYDNLLKPNLKKTRRILNVIRNQDMKLLRKRLLSLMKYKISNSWSNDELIKLTVRTVGELEKSFNIIFSQLREYYSLYLPEIKSVHDKEKYIDLTLKDKEDVLKQLGKDESMGAKLSDEDVNQMKSLSESAKVLLEEIDKKEKYLEKIMFENYPRFTELAGSKVGAQLLKRAGSGLDLAKLPSSSVQIYGAEDALFKHIKYGSKPPKHGIIYNHPKVSSAKKKGRAARKLANKLTIAIRIDVFRDK